jgi:beta-glucosidase/6-phospho-beta-glucosidase/beta-galactosidase
VPWGFRKLLKWIKNEYNNPPVFITENGVSDPIEFNDTLRIHYYTVGIFTSIQLVQHCCSVANMAVHACTIATMDAGRIVYGYN